jgi:hypothetical protein
MPSPLWKFEDDKGQHSLVVPKYEYQPLNHTANEQRFIILHPCLGDRQATENYVQCSIETLPVDSAGSFIAVRNSRAYKRILDAIEIDGKALIVPVAMEIFLRHLREKEKPVRLWARHLCLGEYSPDDRRYWNREFVDSMYGRATEVIDMMAYLLNLREGGIIDQIFDPRYTEKDAEKQWEYSPERTKVPEVLPIRLGKKVDNYAPIDTYDYVTLDPVVEEIRVLIIEPSEEPDSPLITQLAHCPIHCEYGFNALSYTWGKDTPTSEIIISGQRMRVRKNLEQALKALRLGRKKMSAVWIDAICIDQGNIRERNRQIPRLIHIYDVAFAVICYVGERDEESDLAMDLVPKLQGPMMRFGAEGSWEIGSDDRIGPERYPRLCAALYKFLCRPYFTRVWVLQEVATGSNLYIACGNRIEFSFEQLDQAAYNLTDMMNRDPRLRRQMTEADPELEEDLAIGNQLSFIRKMFYFRHLASAKYSPRSLIWGQASKIRDDAPGFLECAILTRDFGATDGHDKLFALWNLAMDKEGLQFEMDYNKSVKQSFMEFVTAWCKKNGSLDIIAAVEYAPQCMPFYATAPSWTPDWQKPSLASCLARKDYIPTTFMGLIGDFNGALYAADGAMKQIPGVESLFEFNDQVLECTGIILDHIVAVFDDYPSEFPDEYSYHPPCPFTHFKAGFWKQKIQQYYSSQKERRSTQYKDTAQAFTAMIHGDMPSTWPPRDQNTENCHERYPDEPYVCQTSESRHVRYYAGSYDRTEAWDTVKRVTRGRVVCVTNHEYMCLAPYWVSNSPSNKPWLLAILATCSVPVLLYENDDGSYRLHGTCFVQGWMEGEVFANTMGVDSPEEFWRAMSGSRNLRIV